MREKIRERERVKVAIGINYNRSKTRERNCSVCHQINRASIGPFEVISNLLELFMCKEHAAVTKVKFNP